MSIEQCKIKNVNFKFNAVTHGILRESVSEYEKVDYEAIFKQLESEYKPATLIETLLLERVVMSYIKLYRINKAEKELMKNILHPEFAGLSGLIPNSYTPKVSDKDVAKLELYSRYETSAENRMYKSINMLSNSRGSRLKNI